MKFIILTLLSFGFAATAQAESLEALFAAQETVTVQPVEVGGIPVDSADAQALCGALGYTRFVSSETALCAEGGTFLTIAAKPGVSAVTIGTSPYQCDDFVDLDGRLIRKVLTSLTCARPQK